jgi:hypothetical protein
MAGSYLQFMVALMVKKYVDEAFSVKLVGQPAPEIKDLEYYQVSAVAGLCKSRGVLQENACAPGRKYADIPGGALCGSALF